MYFRNIWFLGSFILVVLGFTILIVSILEKRQQTTMDPVKRVLGSGQKPISQRTLVDSNKTREQSERRGPHSSVAGVKADRFNPEVQKTIKDLNLDEKSRSHIKKSYVWKGVHYFVFNVDAISDNSARMFLSQCETLKHLQTDGDDGREISWGDRLTEEYGLLVTLPFKVSISFDPEKNIVRYQRMDLNPNGSFGKSTGREILIDSDSNVNEGWRFAHLLEMKPQE